MEEIIDARGLACPQPVVLAKKALASFERIVVFVDDVVARENVRKLGAKLGCEITIDTQADGSFHLHLSHSAGQAVPTGRDDALENCAVPARGSTVIVIASETMGRGNEELGGVLIKAFMHTLMQLETLPDKMLFYNAGVKLAAAGSPVLDDLTQLAGAGVEILVCGTCLNYFGLAGNLAVGSVTNMFEIVSSMAAAEHLLTP